MTLVHLPKMLGLSFPVNLFKRQKSGVLQRGGAMADAGEVLRIRRKRDERRRAGLLDEHGRIPLLVSRTNEELTTKTVEEQLAARILQEWHGVAHVELVCGFARNRLPGRNCR